MEEIPPPHESLPEPQSTTEDKPPIRKSQEEFLDDTAGPSIDKSEYTGGRVPPDRPAPDAG